MFWREISVLERFSATLFVWYFENHFSVIEEYMHDSWFHQIQIFKGNQVDSHNASMIKSHISFEWHIVSKQCVTSLVVIRKEILYIKESPSRLRSSPTQAYLQHLDCYFHCYLIHTLSEKRHTVIQIFFTVFKKKRVKSREPICPNTRSSLKFLWHPFEVHTSQGLLLLKASSTSSISLSNQRGEEGQQQQHWLSISLSLYYFQCV